ncbi:MAG: HIT domain-containing protein [Planctomycetaceae bacterium]|nr:HIT domain-containing protein [Planctomycetaceae bacterium]
MEIHPQLLADCHVLGKTESGVLLLHKNSQVLWLILVPDVLQTDLFAVEGPIRTRIFADCEKIAAIIRQWPGVEKLNFAAIGNVVPQLHLHLVGRHHADPCWPKPVWGNLPESVPYRDEVLEELKTALQTVFVNE